MKVYLVEPDRGLTRLCSGTSGLALPYQCLEGSATDDSDRARAGAVLDYWQIVRRRKVTLLLISFLGGLAALLLTLSQTPVYQANASLEIQPLNENFLNMRDVNPTASGSSYTPEYDIQTQVRVLQSNSILK